MLQRGTRGCKRALVAESIRLAPMLFQQWTNWMITLDPSDIYHPHTLQVLCEEAIRRIDPTNTIFQAWFPSPKVGIETVEYIAHAQNPFTVAFDMERGHGTQDDKACFIQRLFYNL